MRMVELDPMMKMQILYPELHRHHGDGNTRIALVCIAPILPYLHSSRLYFHRIYEASLYIMGRFGRYICEQLPRVDVMM